MATIGRRLILSCTLMLPLLSCEKSRVTSASPPDPIVGAYTLMLSAGPECTSIPEPARNRTYAARIDGTRERYVVTLSGATFERDIQLSERSWQIYCNASSGLGCNQFTASSPDGTDINFQLIHNSERLDDEFGGSGGTIVELITPETRLEVYGRGRGRFDGQAIRATLTGHMWYCSPIQGCDVWANHCETSNLQLTFIR